jgi:hypothetical protein
VRTQFALGFLSPPEINFDVVGVGEPALAVDAVEHDQLAADQRLLGEKWAVAVAVQNWSIGVTHEKFVKVSWYMHLFYSGWGWSYSTDTPLFVTRA